MSGAYNFFPEKFGAEKGVHNVEILLEALLEADGTALAKDVDSYVWAERMAEARVLSYLWKLNRRLANQWDPRRMTDFLPRWERILGIVPNKDDTEVERRAKVGAKLASYGAEPINQVVVDTLIQVLGDVFGSIVHSTSATANGFVPGGVNVPGGANLPDGDWYSTIAYLAIETFQGDLTNATFREKFGDVYEFLDDLVPAWVTFAPFKDGPNGAGFYLDQPQNLNYMRLT